MSSDIPGFTSSMSSLMSSTMTTNDVITSSTANVTTEKPYEDYTVVKVADMLDRVYVPILVSVGLVFNFLCFVTFVFTSLRTTSTCVYMATIAVLDSIILAHSLCVLLSRHFGHTVFYMRSDWACGLHHVVFYTTIHFDVLVLLAMTVDRFIVVRFPLKAQSWCTPKSAVKSILGVGLFSFALNCQILFNMRLIPTGNEKDPLLCWWPDGDIRFFMVKIYTIIDASIYSFIPFLSLLTLNLLIIRQLNQAHQFSKQFTDSREGTNASSTGGGKMDGAKGDTTGSAKSAMTSTNLNVMFLLVSFTFLLLTSPIVIILMYGRHVWQPTTSYQRAHFRLAMACVDNLMYSNHAINFLLYCVSGRRFRQELGRLVSRFCCRS